jgi:3-phenylpropionate/trans-cinnamate dioxygenase ferredoxin reductase subunit
MVDGALIVGGGQAGVQLAASLRSEGYPGPITLVGAENALPYQRPPLSKGYLLGAQTREALVLRKREFFESKNIDVLTDTTIVDIKVADLVENGGVAFTDAGQRIPFTDLAVTVGAAPRKLPLIDDDAPNVFYVRTLADADRLRTGIEDARAIVVIGGGFIGLEAAAVLSSLGKAVTVIEALPSLLGRVAGPVLGDFYLSAHRRRGVDFRLGHGVSAVDTDSAGAVQGLTLANGDTLACDAVVVGIGLERDRTLADQLGVDWNNGIVVDSGARTSRPRIVAAGDCTVGPHPMASGHIRLESVQNAVDQAKIAAGSLCGRQVHYDSVPWFWSDQGSIKLQMAGLSNGYDDFLVRGEPDDERFSVLYVRAGKIIAIESVNLPQDFMLAKKALATGRSRIRDVSSLSDLSVSLKDALD